MTMQRRHKLRQETLWIASSELPEGPGHPFYTKLEKILIENKFDAFAESKCAECYSEKMGRPSIAPGVYFRMLLIGYFERIDSERGIAWRCEDSLSLRQFLGIELKERTPDHSSLSRIRTRFSIETHESVFGWVLKVIARSGLIDGKTLGVDATTLEANAALRSIVRRDTGEGYTEFLKNLAKESGIESPTRADLAKLDKKRPKKGSNDDWTHPHDPDAQITKMKDGRTHLAHKAEQTVDMSGSGAILAVKLYGGAKGDTATGPETIDEARKQLEKISRDKMANEHLHENVGKEVVADKGYHSNELLVKLENAGMRTYISEPDRGRRDWDGKAEAQKSVYANRRRIIRDRGKKLLRMRGELLERPFAHCFESGGMRRTHLRGHENILKRLLVHVAGFNLGLMMRSLFGNGTPREFAAAAQILQNFGLFVADVLLTIQMTARYAQDRISVWCRLRAPFRFFQPLAMKNATSSTGC